MPTGSRLMYATLIVAVWLVLWLLVGVRWWAGLLVSLLIVEPVFRLIEWRTGKGLSGRNRQ